MAVRGKPLPVALVALLWRLSRHCSISAVAKQANVSRPTVYKYLRGTDPNGGRPYRSLRL